jgi:hypothetical protein
MPWVEHDALLAFARREGASLLAAPEWQLRAAGFPTAGRLAPEGDHPGLTYVATIGREEYLVHVFRVETQAAP